MTGLLCGLLLMLNAGCEPQEAYKSRAVEVFPPIPMRHVALFRMDGLPIGPVYFQGQWSVVAFGTSSCQGDCLQRLDLLEKLDQPVNKLFVIDDLADHSKLRELAQKSPSVAVTMGISAASFDNFYDQFDTDTGESIDKHQQFYLVNPLAELAYSLQQQGLKPGDIDRELELLGM